jgi:Zn ribbon nucleic-acid-binding protein
VAIPLLGTARTAAAVAVVLVANDILPRNVATSVNTSCTSASVPHAMATVVSASSRVTASTVVRLAVAYVRIVLVMATSAGLAIPTAAHVVMEWKQEETTTVAPGRTGDRMATCKDHFCTNPAANDCEYSLCGACCNGCSRHETLHGSQDNSQPGGECGVCGYDEWEITLAEHQDPDSGYCDHSRQYKQEEDNGYTYAYCLCCDKRLGLSTW